MTWTSELCIPGPSDVGDAALCRQAVSGPQVVQISSSVGVGVMQASAFFNYFPLP